MPICSIQALEELVALVQDLLLFQQGFQIRSQTLAQAENSSTSLMDTSATEIRADRPMDDEETMRTFSTEMKIYRTEIM